MKGKREYSSAFAILNVLMNAEDYLTTKQIVERTGCDRKTVYNAVASFECYGFGIDIKTDREGVVTRNLYRYTGLYGM